MGEMAIYDSHVHSKNSFDGHDTVEAICESAIRAGLAAVTFTDHCETYLGEGACLAVKEALWEDVSRARETFGEALEISMGLEIGEPHRDMALSRELAGGPEIDFVIGSVHRVRGEDDFYFMDYDRPDIMDVFRKYYEEILELSECDCFDVMGHINYPLRAMSAEQTERTDLGVFDGLLRETLASLAAHGRGIEANSHCMKEGVGGILPSLEIMKMFRDSGGRIVTTGSDAHEASLVGAGIPEAEALLREAGFKEISFFKGRKPI
ncbi:MAG: histidinol-phosphatase HisJ family protein [Synergistaceae bacterium]|jgi:histidinol-phosphatase (PHP family)|nr:histidinol-phosphatase HisJ family protein [Synergistaceae bacterium]